MSSFEEGSNESDINFGFGEPSIFYEITTTQQDERLEDTTNTVRSERVPRIREDGWRIVIDASNGFICLTNSGNQLHLAYDGDPLPSELISNTLQLNNCGSTPIFTNDSFVKTENVYTSDQLPQGGSVYVIADYQPNNTDPALYITDDGDLMTARTEATVMPNKIFTSPHNFASILGIGPNAEPAVIQDYKEKFIMLASIAAYKLGNPQTITTEFNDAVVMTPEDLDRERFMPTLKRGNPRLLPRGNDTIVYGRSDEKKVILMPGNKTVPWICLRRMPVDASVADARSLAQVIEEGHLFI